MAIIEERQKANGEKTYRVKVRIKGYPVQSATFNLKTDAKKWASTTEAAIHEGRYFKRSQAKRKTFGDMIDRYIEEILPLKPKSQVKQNMQLTYWKDKLGNMILHDIGSSHIAAIKNELAAGQARLTQKLVKQNFALAVIYNLFAIPLALAGFVTPLIAALAMSGSSLIVIANSFRLKLKS